MSRAGRSGPAAASPTPETPSKAKLALEGGATAGRGGKEVAR